MLSALKIRLDFKSKMTGRYYCSLGLMVIDNRLFKLLPKYKNMDDLDVIVRKLFNKQNNLVDYKMYTGDWFSIHTKEDIDKINQYYYSKP